MLKFVYLGCELRSTTRNCFARKVFGEVYSFVNIRRRTESDSLRFLVVFCCCCCAELFTSLYGVKLCDANTFRVCVVDVLFTLVDRFKTAMESGITAENQCALL